MGAVISNHSDGSRIESQHLEVLSGWKEIANYLHKGVRTVQRYEWELGLPVRRPAGKDKGAVLAVKSELDAWVLARPSHKSVAFNSNRGELLERIERMKKLCEEIKYHAANLQLAKENLWKSVYTCFPQAKGQRVAPLAGVLVDLNGVGPLDAESRRLPE